MEQTKYDVFISYSSKDQKIAEGICGYLESKKIRCFVAYRDIPLGIVWASAIAEAIDECKVMVVVFSQEFNMSPQTDREIELAAENRIPIITYRIMDAELTGAKKYYLKNLNWIDAFPHPESFFGDLNKYIHRLLQKEEVVENAENSKNIIQNDDTQNAQLEADGNIIDGAVYYDYIDLIEDVDNDYSAEQLYEKGYNYYYGKGVEGDVLMAVNYLLSAAKMNHAKAQSFLYKCYCLCIGVDKDKNKALYWIKRSAENNDAESQLKYAKELIKLENYDDAAHWLETIVNNYYLSQSNGSEIKN